MIQLKLLWNKFHQILSNRSLYLIVALVSIVFMINKCNESKELQRQQVIAGKTIDSLKFTNKQLKLSDSTHAVEVKALEVKSSKELAGLRDSLAIAMNEKSKLQKQLGLIKFTNTFQPGKIPTINIDSIAQRITDSLKSLPCDTLKKLADSNLLYIPASFNDSSKYYIFKGKIIRKDGKIGIDFDSTYPRFISKPTIIFGEKRSWFLGKWKTVAQIGDENPYMQIDEAKYIQVKNKERRFGITVGYGATYNIQSKSLTHGPTIVFGLRF